MPRLKSFRLAARQSLRESVDVLLGDALPLGDGVERAKHRHGHHVIVEPLQT